MELSDISKSNAIFRYSSTIMRERERDTKVLTSYRQTDKRDREIDMIRCQ